MAYGGRRENASRSSSIQESGFSFLNLFKGSQIHEFGVLHFMIFSDQKNCIPSRQTMFALFYSQSGDRGAFHPGEVVLPFHQGSPWGTFIAARSAPDPTLDMDRRVGNFLLVE